MAGANEILKEGTVLFHEGDASDGMYIVRKGEVQVYLEKGGQEIKLATVTSGAMIGEMALFDKKPRSAAAKAITETEVTKISNDDFKKILKQIPKWFVALMITLSSRLRETNERLQAIETKTNGKGSPLDNTSKVVGILSLLWHKEGRKEGKSWVLERNIAEIEVEKILSDPTTVRKIIDALAKSQIIMAKTNSFKKQVLVIPNKGVLEKLLDFLKEFSQNNPGEKQLPEASMYMLEIIGRSAKEFAYENVTISMEDIAKEGESAGHNTTTWKNSLTAMKNLGHTCKIVKVSNGVGFRVDKKSFPEFLQYCRVLAVLAKEGAS